MSENSQNGQNGQNSENHRTGRTRTAVARRTRRTSRALVAAAGVGALAVLATGCGGGTSASSGDGDSEQAGKRSGKPATPVAVASSPQAATWTDGDDKARPIELAPKSLARGSAADLAHVQLDDDMKGMVPYYLTFSVTNTGRGALDRPDPESGFAVVGADGRPGERLMLMANPLATGSGSPESCDKGVPATLAAGRTAEACQVFMLPKGQEPTAVSYTDDDAAPLIWKAGDGKSGASGGVLAAGASADSVWRNSDDRPVPVKITPKSVRAGDIADLSRFDLDEDEKELVPYYVTVEYRNTGEYDLYPGLQDDLELRSASGQPSRPLVLIDIGGPGVGECPDATPDEMVKPGATVTQCSIHLLARTDRPATFTLSGDDPKARPLTWTATVTD
ncbi:hypothetical protein ACWEJP_21645 [Streptomyces sp. NPDC004749]